METQPPRKPYPSDVTDEEGAFVAPYLPLVREDAPNGRMISMKYFNILRWMVRTGSPWRHRSTDFPPWEAAVYQQAQRWIGAGVFAAMVDDLRVLLRWLQGAPMRPPP